MIRCPFTRSSYRKRAPSHRGLFSTLDSSPRWSERRGNQGQQLKQSAASSGGEVLQPGLAAHFSLRRVEKKAVIGYRPAQ
jgi:hypothetical protein